MWVKKYRYGNIDSEIQVRKYKHGSTNKEMMIKKYEMKKSGSKAVCLTEGGIIGNMLLFAVPMIAGNLLQQVYNIADTVIVGRYIGPQALAAVGAAYTLMTFLTSVIIGLCMGSGAVYSIFYGAREMDKLKESIWASFWMISLVTVMITGIVFAGIDQILVLLKVPGDVYDSMRAYVFVIFMGIGFVFLYNYFACLLRAVGNSVTPLVFLAAASLLNIILDIWFVVGLDWGVEGAAGATVIAQGTAGVGIMIYTLVTARELYPKRCHRKIRKDLALYIGRYSLLTCIQQSVMNFGILMIQGLVNRFGTVIMAAFAAAVKIDTLAYMPAQEFGNAFSVFVAQNHGAGKQERIRKGVGSAMAVSVIFCVLISAVVWIAAGPLMEIFVERENQEIIRQGVCYLHIEGAFYWGIGCLFLLYGLYRGMERPGMSLVLTVISLGTRVFLAYLLAPNPLFGVKAIWWAIPIGWVLADTAGLLYYKKSKVCPIAGADRKGE